MVRDELLSRGMECFLPLRTRISRWRGQSKRIEWTIFPGYCFVRISNEQHCMVAETSGVIEIVCDELGSVAIPEAEIIAIQRLIECGLRYDCHYSGTVNDGVTVNVIRGRLLGVQGTVARKDGAWHLILSIHLVRKGLSVEIDPDDTNRRAELLQDPSQ